MLLTNSVSYCQNILTVVMNLNLTGISDLTDNLYNKNKPSMLSDLLFKDISFCKQHYDIVIQIQQA